MTGRVSLMLASASPARLGLLQAAGVDPMVLASDVDELALEREYTARRGLGQADSAGLSVVLAQAKAQSIVAQIGSTREAITNQTGDSTLVANPTQTRSSAQTGDPTQVINPTQTPSSTLPGGDTEKPHPTQTANPVVPGRSGSSSAPATPDVVVGADTILEFYGMSLGKPGDAATASKRLAQMSGGHGVLHTGHCVIDTKTGETRSAVESTPVRFAELTPQEIAAYVATGEPINVAGSFTIDGFGSAFVTGIDGSFTNVVGLSIPLLRQLVADLGYQWIDFWR